MEILKYKRHLLELKKRLMISLKPEVEKIQQENDNKEDMEYEIDCALSSLISVEIFNNKELDDKELSIFLDTYYYMLYYATIIDDTRIELYNILDEAIEAEGGLDEDYQKFIEKNMRTKEDWEKLKKINDKIEEDLKENENELLEEII